MAITSPIVKAWHPDFEGFACIHHFAAAGPRALIAIMLTIHVMVVVLLAVPAFRCVAVSCTTSLGHIVWNHVSSPSAPRPAGDLTMSLIKLWSNHILEVELPWLRQKAERFSWE